jgi:hypothetical protein
LLNYYLYAKYLFEEKKFVLFVKKKPFFEKTTFISEKINIPHFFGVCIFLIPSFDKQTTPQSEKVPKE